MDTHNLLFLVFSAAAIGFALMTVLGKNPVSSAFSLILVFFAFAGIYALLNAHLVATLQILLYAGAIMVLFIFVIMLLNADEPSMDLGRSPKWFLGLSGLAILGLVGLFVHIFTSERVTAVMQGQHTPEAVAAAGGNTKLLSLLMFSEYLLPFELVSVLLLAAIVAAVAIAKRHHTKATIAGRSRAATAADRMGGK